MVNEAPREFPESNQCTPKGFSKGKPKATYKARPKAKNPRGRRPQGFLVFGLTEDVAKGLPLENSEGGLQPPEGSIHHDTGWTAILATP